MTVVNRVRNNKVYKFDILMILVIIFCCLIFVENRTIPLVMNDEFGYWGNAKFFFDDSWKPLMKFTPYYSIGYSLLLLPIIFVTENMQTMYQCAVGVNVFFLIVCYFIIKYIIATKYDIKNSQHISILSLTILLTSENLMHTQIAWSETLLTLLMWISVGLVVSVSEKYNPWKIVALFAVWFYMYLVHQRSVGVIFIGVIVILMVSLREKRKIPIVIMLVSLPIVVITQRILSDLQTQVILSDSVTSDINVLTINTSLVKDTLLTVINNIKMISISILGKMFYVLISSSLTVLVATYYIGIKACKLIIEHKFSKIDITELYVVLSLAIMFILTSIRMHGTDRMDFVVYSRYFEFTIGPMIMIGLIRLFKAFWEYRNIVVYSFVFLVIIMQYIIETIERSRQEFNIYCSPYIGSIYFKNLRMGEEELAVRNSIYTIMVIIFFILVAFIISNRIKNKDIAIFIMCGTIMFVNLGIFRSLNTQMIEWQRELYKSIDPIVEELNRDKDRKIYYIKEFCKTGYGNEIKYLQFILGDRTIDVFENDVNFINEENIFIIVDGKQGEILTGITKIKETDKYTLYKY